METSMCVVSMTFSFSVCIVPSESSRMNASVPGRSGTVLYGLIIAAAAISSARPRDVPLT